MRRFGLKLWSNNQNYVKEAVALYKKGIYQYIELYVLPSIDDTQVSIWKNIHIPYVIHAPHFRDGLNLAKKELKKNNLLLIKKTQEIAEILQADKIIVHPGIAGDIAETVRQLREINDARILIENKPYYALDDGLICNGATIEEIMFILNRTDAGFCLDIGHAFCAANANKIEPLEYLKQLLALNPDMFHLTDGEKDGVLDRHYHFGKGNYNIKDILDILPDNCNITVETIKDFNDSLEDFEKDIKFLKKFMNIEYQIKLADEDDMVDVFKLSNDPDVRQNSFNQEPISIEKHKDWFKNKVDSKDCIFYIIRDKYDELIGYSRFDKDLGQNHFVISVCLNSKYRGKGLGRKIIKQTSCMVETNKHSKIIAYVKENNHVSFESFRKSGYDVITKDTINGTPCYKLKFSHLCISNI